MRAGAATRAAPAFIVEASLHLHLKHARQRIARLLHHSVHHGGTPTHQDGSKDSPNQHGEQASFRFHSLRFQALAPHQHGDQAVQDVDLHVESQPVGVRSRDASAAKRYSSSRRSSSAKKIFSAVNGMSLKRMPSASWIALAIAGAVAIIGCSPTPRAPHGPSSCGTST
jgi:hypothetical protein